MEFNQRGKVLLAVGVAVISLAAIFVYFLVLNKDYELVFAEQPPEQLAKVATSLENAGMKFQYPESGQGILIEKSKLAEARVQLSKDQVFQSDITGLEIFGEAQHAMSDFYQKINYQRAIQGELEKSLLTIQGVSSARVHLAIPRERTFSQNKTPVKAAVTLTLSASEPVNQRALVATVKQLVSNSVINLEPENVSVLNSNGLILSGGVPSLDENASFGIKKEIEQDIEAKVIQLLSAYFEASQIGVSAWATVNNDKIKESSEGLESAEAPVVTKRVTETTQGSKNKPKSTVLNEEFSYKSVKRDIDYQRGKLERLTVSVMIPESEYFTKDVLQNLLRTAIGINETRGDQLSVALIPVEALQPEAAVQEIRPALEASSSLNAETDAHSQTQSQSQLGALPDTEQPWLWGSVGAFVLLLIAFQHGLYRRKLSLKRDEEAMILKDVSLWLEGRELEQNTQL
ncbi:hypothetical protein L4174_006425 [Photobacterium sp. CCB-ST2H9]|uniref:flagellar M-ring protein FliF C-terminal domain-containing protein n=1 Tax=Photobacterium sp. CCB-ST2H9 TaxID=2912855 RepID=UPI002005593E|nr:flagellar M-ring protein FliF C-terminal domain-containing protein [Photobacterium sp. CCB-ST2H9]UTM58471.1 hypothetical protein L4174_006425 [Photobacterium sp. CCB-ST2H9]